MTSMYMMTTCVSILHVLCIIIGWWVVYMRYMKRHGKKKLHKIHVEHVVWVHHVRWRLWVYYGCQVRIKDLFLNERIENLQARYDDIFYFFYAPRYSPLIDFVGFCIITYSIPVHKQKYTLSKTLNRIFS